MFSDVFIRKDQSIHVNPNAELFREHFENYPIVPGAFSMSLSINELLRQFTEQENLQLQNIHKIRFLRPIKPNDTIHFKIKKLKKTDNDLTANFEIINNDRNLLVDGVVSLGETI